MAEQDFKWYVIRVISGQERKIQGYIEAELTRENQMQNINQILIPMEKYFQMKNGKKVTKERNFFPGYVLLEADLNGEVLAIIRAVNGVVGFLGAKDAPTPMRQSEINRILGKVDALNEAGDSLDTPFVIGEKVKVIDGPFNGFSGSVDEIYEDRKKVKVIVKIFERATPLELNYAQVDKE